MSTAEFNAWFRLITIIGIGGTVLIILISVIILLFFYFRNMYYDNYRTD